MAAWLTVGVSLVCAADMSPEQRTFFESRIRPVLVKHCYECHSQQSTKIGGKLLLDAPSEMIAGGESGPALLPGKPDESLIVQAVRYDGIEMPPKYRLPEQVVADFTEWVRMGAPDPRSDLPKTSAKAASKPLWSLQPVTGPGLPEVKDKQWPRSSIDVFALAKMESKGMSPGPDARMDALRRRLAVDLTGLPPLSDQQNLARYVDELLESPHFGERWGRHWLDVARYAESNGNDGLSRNASFPHAWRYRDYVISSFNRDLPFDRFITEQVAGDLLPYESPSQRDRQLIATGFLALGAKPAKAMNDNFEMDVIADQIAAIGSGILGLTVGCARCHDHKTDPIPTRDYYALAGIFRSTETLWGAAAHQGLTAPQTALHELNDASKVAMNDGIEPIISKYTPRRPPAKASFAYQPDSPLAMGVRESKRIANAQLNIDGESKKLGAPIPRGFLSACGALGMEWTPNDKASGRLELARWLTHASHPLTARVIVNRVWQHLFGVGLVSTPDDFGFTGELPTHPELLDHLAATFVRDGWSVKRLIRRIVLSRTYQLSASKGDATWLTHHQRRRMDAETMRDCMLAATGSLILQPAQGSLIQQRDVLINELPALHQPSLHRSIYLLMLRNSMPPELTPFNLPDATTVTGKRDSSAMSTQSLYLLNNKFLVDQSMRFAQRLDRLGGTTEQKVSLAYRFTLGREATVEEVREGERFVMETASELASASLSSREPLIAAWAAFSQALLASSELRYVD
ncbi:MAG: PSD1 domain-containing protein [Verrucomicrobiaceae bacterium]|nr:PSD1 domain-containing protein [Verrucomicrobiaceae bacterium]